MNTKEKNTGLNGAAVEKKLTAKGKRIFESIKDAQEVMKNLSLKTKIIHPVR